MDTNTKNFLDLTAWSEGTSTSKITKDNGYDVIVSGVDGQHRMTDYSAHPFANGRPAIVINHAGLKSTASGRYQIMLETWKEVSAHLGLKDFSPENQDAACVELLRRRKALPAIQQGNIEAAICLCHNEWASFPGNNYDQGGHALTDLMEQYKQIASA